MKENPLKVVSPFYNAGKYIEKCINSVKTQKYNNFTHVIVNDNSTDDSHEVILKSFQEKLTLKEKNSSCEIYQGDKIIYINNFVRKGALENLVYTFENFCNDEDIICSLDGDDFLMGKKVLQYINAIFNEKNIDFMYGGCSWSDGNACCSRPYNQETFKNIRKHRGYYLISQMRNFSGWVFSELKKQDPNLNSLKDKNGNFYQMTYDVALYIPISEIVGFDKIYHNKKPIYYYNRENPINDDKVNQALQWQIHEEIIKKKAFVTTKHK